MSNDYLRIATTHSLVIQFPTSRDKREEFYKTIRDRIITPFFRLPTRKCDIKKLFRKNERATLKVLNALS